ncbi:hypothetical protein HZ994_00285 [Akkermansiaceae bacterium]|nr:hypothetical protein HZ994_00285 [Akkermansiaceae bacterium]
MPAMHNATVAKIIFIISFFVYVKLKYQEPQTLASTKITEAKNPWSVIMLAIGGCGILPVAGSLPKAR